MSYSKTDFRYVMCPGSQPDPRYADLHQEIFHCWETVWKQAFQELHVDKPLYSDSFTRQDFIGALLYKDHCVGMTFFRWANANGSEFAKDSYFSNWEQEHIDVLRSRGPEIIVFSNLSILPEARGMRLGVPTKEVILGVAVENFMSSRADAMTGTPRRDRNVNEGCRRWGATNIALDVPSGYGDTVDIVAFFKDQVSEAPPHILKSFVKDLWDHRLEISRVEVHEHFAAKKHLKAS